MKFCGVASKAIVIKLGVPWIRKRLRTSDLSSILLDYKIILNKYKRNNPRSIDLKACAIAFMNSAPNLFIITYILNYSHGYCFINRRKYYNAEDKTDFRWHQL
jgi:hypothetical protein